MARKDELIRLLEAQTQAKRFNRMRSFVPYAKQREFFALGATHHERLLFAGNQQGKTLAGAFEMACHLTGEYPEWWTGRRFNRPVRAWCIGESSQQVRDGAMAKLCGGRGDELLGTGMLPQASFIGTPSVGHGVSDFFDTARIRHKSGGVSVVQWKTYEQGREKLQGVTCDVVWLDEEPDMGIYQECLARVVATGGIVYMTFTPLHGISDVVRRFLYENSPDRATVTMTIDDALHIPAEERQRIIDSYLPHERDARARGVPLLGSGRVFNAPETEITAQPFAIPAHYALLWGIDPGVGHPFAAALLAWDKDSDAVYVVLGIRMADALPLQHAAAMKAVLNGWGRKIPVAWPQDATQRREFEGRLEPLAKVYKAHGLNMASHHATFADGSNSTELGILQMQERFASARLKVFASCTEWFEEYRQYYRKDGQIVKIRDDLMSATRVGVMALRHARPVLFDPHRPGYRVGDSAQVARDVEIDPWD
jgi:phage terminase large subunit-like protein